MTTTTQKGFFNLLSSTIRAAEIHTCAFQTFLLQRDAKRVVCVHDHLSLLRDLSMMHHSKRNYLCGEAAFGPVAIRTLDLSRGIPVDLVA